MQGEKILSDSELDLIPLAILDPQLAAQLLHLKATPCTARVSKPAATEATPLASRRRQSWANTPANGASGHYRKRKKHYTRILGLLMFLPTVFNNI